MNEILGISIPTYKRPEQLLATVRSVAAAGGCEHGIPVFIADDSTDETNAAVYRIIMAEYPFLHVSRNGKNLGIDANIVHSVDVNTCRYAWLLGEDDHLLPGAVAPVLRKLVQDPPFVYVNYASVNADFSRMLKPVSLPLQDDVTVPSDRFWREYAWSAGFIGACVVRKADWDSVDRQRYIGSWFAHVGTIMEFSRGRDIPMIARPLVQNRCGTTEVFTWTSSLMDVLDGWRRLCVLLEPLYGAEACQASLRSFRQAHGLGTVKFLAYARAGGALTPSVVRAQILPGKESSWFKVAAQVVSRLPIAWLRAMQRWRYR